MTTYRGSGTTGSGSVLVTTASEITNAAAGDIEATNVQDAINELGDEKANITNPVFTGDATFGGASTQIGSNANPVVWKSDTISLQLGDTAAFWTNIAGGAGNASVIGQNAFSHEATGDTYIITDEASRYYQIGGEHIFEVAVSGTAGDGISWSTALTLDSSGDATFGGNVSLADNKRLYVGVGGLELYATGSDTRIFSNTGTLYIKNQINSAVTVLSSFDSAGGTKNGIIVGGTTPYVRLYYGGIEQLKTTATGINISNIPTSSAGLNAGDVWSNSGVLTIV